MQFDTALNLIWLVLGVFALASILRMRRKASLPAHHAPAWLHVCGVALILAALFPYISATDDVLRIQHMDVQETRGQHQTPGKKGPIDGLLRLYEAMDTPVVCAVREISFTLFFVSIVITPVLRFVDRIAPLKSGRSPPLRCPAV
ncbi:MAG: DUF2304 domain-containing protein [Acidobacteriaceae bacterium]|nr:DUF2304 domain-containing protein [Acidobacteriaceae bacterium]